MRFISLLHWPYHGKTVIYFHILLVKNKYKKSYTFYNIICVKSYNCDDILSVIRVTFLSI